MQLMVKNGWFHKDEKKDTCGEEGTQITLLLRGENDNSLNITLTFLLTFWVSGSINQFQAPVAVQTDTTIKITAIKQNRVRVEGY